MRINNNIMALNTHRQYGINNANISKSTEKLSSGYRINRAGDDAAGLAISEKMRAQIRGLTMASKNSQDAISLVQTAEGALQETHNILQRMRELATQSASDTNETSIDRNALNLEFQELIKEIDDTASKTKFNDMGLIDGSFASNTTYANTVISKVDKAWAGSTVEAGTYAVSARTVETAAEVTANAAALTAPVTLGAGAINQQAEANAVGGGTATNGDGELEGAFAIQANLESTDANGTWSITYADNKFTATNATTGQVKTATINDSARTVAGAGGTLAVAFDGLGTLTFTNGGTAADDTAEFQGLATPVSVTVSGGRTAKAAEYKDVISINGEEVDLAEGASTVVFKQNNITLNLSSAHKKAASPAAGPLADYSGNIEVSKETKAPFVVQTGANQGDELAINIEKMDAATLGVKTANISSRLDASAAITQTNNAINLVSTQRAALGALQNRLNHKISNLDTSAENLTAAESRIRDVDMAKEMTTFTKNNILFQASTAMLAQANAAPQGVLQLLG